MARTSYMPSKQADQVIWATTFASVVAPLIALYGVPQAMMTEFSAAVAAMVDAWTAYNTPETRTKTARIAKDNAILEMRRQAAKIVSVIQGMPDVTDMMLENAGLTIRKTKPTPKPVPTEKPFIQIANVDGRSVSIELRQDTSRRGKPTDVTGAAVFTSVGPTPPASMNEWTFTKLTTLTTVQLEFPPSTTGDIAWVTAFWTNGRGDTGPAANAVSIHLPAATVLPRAETKMRIAKAA